MIVYKVSPVPTLNAWTNYTIPLSESGWHVGTPAGVTPPQLQFQSVLGSLAGLRVTGEFGATVTETVYLDNVVMSSIPEPSTLLVWSGLGAIGAVVAYRRKRRAA